VDGLLRLEKNNGFHLDTVKEGSFLKEEKKWARLISKYPTRRSTNNSLALVLYFFGFGGNGLFWPEPRLTFRFRPDINSNNNDNNIVIIIIITEIIIRFPFTQGLSTLNSSQSEKKFAPPPPGPVLQIVFRILDSTWSEDIRI
jgi:hypothetical protein